MLFQTLSAFAKVTHLAKQVSSFAFAHIIQQAAEIDRLLNQQQSALLDLEGLVIDKLRERRVTQEVTRLHRELAIAQSQLKAAEQRAEADFIELDRIRNTHDTRDRELGKECARMRDELAQLTEKHAKLVSESGARVRELEEDLAREKRDHQQIAQQFQAVASELELVKKTQRKPTSASRPSSETARTPQLASSNSNNSKKQSARSGQAVLDDLARQLLEHAARQGQKLRGRAEADIVGQLRLGTVKQHVAQDCQERAVAELTALTEKQAAELQDARNVCERQRHEIIACNDHVALLRQELAWLWESIRWSGAPAAHVRRDSC